MERFSMVRHGDHEHCGLESDPEGAWVRYSDAMEVGCEHSQDEDACGECRNCLRVALDAALRSRGEALAALDALQAKFRIAEHLELLEDQQPAYLRSLMADAVRDFHGKAVLFSTAFLNAAKER